MKINGYVRDKDGAVLEGALVEVKDERFQTIYKAECGTDGYFELELPAGRYPFLTAVRDYGARFLEYWGMDIDASRDLTLDIRIDTLEIYGLNAFEVKGGGYPSVMAYFRPMSLGKFQRGESDICPDLGSVTVRLDGREAQVAECSEVRECVAGETSMRAFLIQAAKPEGVSLWQRLDVEIRDKDGNYGAASLFR